MTSALQALMLVLLGVLLYAQGRMPVAGRDAIKEPFKGLTLGGAPPPRELFTIKRSGVSTEPVRRAAEAYLASLTPEQKAKTLYPVNDLEWQLWDNRHFAPRQGVSYLEMTEAQREKATALLRSGLSARGLQQSLDIMKLNGTLAELTNDWKQYGDQLYWITIMGTPSAKEPWGWQLDGHHVIVNYFVLGDQVVMTPVFMGSEPIRAEAGKFKGTVVLQPEQDQGLAMMQALTPAQQAEAQIAGKKGSTNNLLEAYKDNVNLEQVGVPGAKLDKAQRQRLRDLIAIYVGNLDDGHARVKMAEVDKHLDATRFAWLGGSGNDAVFYYRIQSPVIVIEFDHQGPIALSRDRTPTRNHIHTVVRTPNGNDYGKDLLRQHLERQRH